LKVQRYRIETGFYRLNDPMSVARGLAAALETDPDILWVSYSETATGQFIGARRNKADEYVLNLSDPRVNGGVPREYRADTGAAFVRTPPFTDSYDPRTREWYRRAVAAGGNLTWTSPYTFAEGIRGTTAAMAVKNRDGQVQGVVTVDFSLAGLDTFLGRIKIGERGVVVLFDSGGELLAGGPSAGREAAARAIGELRRGTSAADAGVRRAEVRLGDETWDIAARSLVLTRGLAWTAAVAVPDAEFMGPVYA